MSELNFTSMRNAALIQCFELYCRPALLVICYSFLSIMLAIGSMAPFYVFKLNKYYKLVLQRGRAVINQLIAADLFKLVLKPYFTERLIRN